MVQWVLLLQALASFTSITCKPNRKDKARIQDEYADSLWKKEYESELVDAMLNSKNRDNASRHTFQRMMSDKNGHEGDAVIEKLVDSITASEKYLKKVDNIDFRLNRLDIEVHEKTNTIMKRLSEILKSVRAVQRSENMEVLLSDIKDNILKVKLSLEQNPQAILSSPSGANAESDNQDRLMAMEGNIKAILSGVDVVVSTMSEVKNRQFMKAYPKSNDFNDPMVMVNELRKMMHDQRSSSYCEPTTRTGRVDRSERYPTDCHEIQMQGFNVSGIYKIRPEDMQPFYVLCDLTTNGGSWTVIQNRYDGSQDFFKTWSEYKHGFGNLAGEFWLGLEKLYFLTNQKLYELRVEVETQHGQEANAGYSVFTLGPEYEGFRISTLGTYYGTAGDSLSYHAGQKFSTPDVDNDDWKDGSCAAEHGGAWWYKECDKSNLNGKYVTVGEESKGQSVYWISFKGPNTPLSKTKMMIRPLPATRPALDRKPAEKLKRPHDKMRSKEKANYDVSRQFRYEDPGHAEAFFPSYSR